MASERAELRGYLIKVKPERRREEDYVPITASMTRPSTSESKCDGISQVFLSLPS